MRVLLVEDEADLRLTLAQALREDGYAVDEAEDGREGWHRASECAYDAIILDVMLPHKSGWELLEELRKKRKTPVLMLTARGTSEDRVRGLDLGADDYVVKPFDLPEMLARVRAIIRRTGGEASSLITVGPVRLDLSQKTAEMAGRVLDLTAREFALVEYLALRRGQVVSRTELYDHLFAEDDESFSNLLDVHVCNVRKKVGRDFIATRRGHGFILEEE